MQASRPTPRAAAAASRHLRFSSRRLKKPCLSWSTSAAGLVHAMENRPLSGAYRPDRDAPSTRDPRRKTVRDETSTAQLRGRRRDRRRLSDLRRHRHPLPAAARRRQGARLGMPGMLGIPFRAWHWLHDWSGVVATVGVLVHTALHYRWIVTMTRRTFGSDRHGAARRGGAPAAWPAAPAEPPGHAAPGPHRPPPPTRRTGPTSPGETTRAASPGGASSPAGRRAGRRVPGRRPAPRLGAVAADALPGTNAEIIGAATPSSDGSDGHAGSGQRGAQGAAQLRALGGSGSAARAARARPSW